MKYSPSAGFGDRLKKFRLLSGLSAQKLSDKLGGDISRGVIANIESGVKTDVTVDELLLLAWALKIPPVMLALPVDEPNKSLDLHTTSSGHIMTELVYDLVRFFHGEPARPKATKKDAAQVYSMSLLKALETLRRAQASYRSLKGDENGPGGSSEDLQHAWVAVREAEDDLTAFGVAAPDQIRMFY